MTDNSIDSIVTDPPYGLTTNKKGGTGVASVNIESPYGRARIGVGNGAGGFMGHKWDSDVPSVEIWAECLRVLKPGGYLLAFAGTRTQHRMATRIEDAGFEIRDMIAWVYGSGFPKSHNGEWGGTALKPALEPITMARKPLIGTVAANWAEHGTGALNIDGCRVAGESTARHTLKVMSSKGAKGGALGNQDHKYAERDAAYATGSDAGRWPANLLHDGSDEVVAGFPAQAGASAPVRGTEASAASVGKVTGERARVPGYFHGDTSSAARFFYCAKASRADRNEGLPSSSTPAVTIDATMRDCQTAEWSTRNGNHHPTVKPTDLMAYLVRLVTPAGGVVLDPFMGSGSTGKAAMREGFRFVGCELSPEYLAIARTRIEHERDRVEAARLAAEVAAAPAPQFDLFATV